MLDQFGVDLVNKSIQYTCWTDIECVFFLSTLTFRSDIRLRFSSELWTVGWLFGCAHVTAV